jgi:polar amino acid transport system ATP-binding protein
MTTSHPPASPQLVLEDVHKSYGSNHVLRGVSMSIAASEIVCIIGPSGSGKSTILRCINALTPIDSGSITVGGIEVNDAKLDELALRRYVGMVFQSYNLFPHRTVLQNVMMAPIQVLKQKKADVEPRARALLAKVRLKDKENAYPGELSGGQQQRVAIARSLCMNPQVMMFDEVTAALDPETVKEVLTTIREVARDGMTCILVTHEMRFAREIANTVYFTDNGRIVEFGAPREFFDHPKDERTKAFLDKVL